MSRRRVPYDEIMIVNPVSEKGASTMKFYPIQHMPLGAYVEDRPEEMGYAGDPPPGFTEGVPANVGYVAKPYGGRGYGAVGYIAAEPCDAVGYIAEDPYEEVGYVAEDPYGEVGYVAEDPYGEMEGVAWVGDEEEEFAAADDDDEMGDYGDEEAVEGYVREDREPAFSPRVVPTEHLAGVEGYVKPKSINPTAETIRPAEVVSQPASSWFKPLW